MCTTCGCSDTGGVTLTNLATGRRQSLDGPALAHELAHELVYRPLRGRRRLLEARALGHALGHVPERAPAAPAATLIGIEQDILSRNRRLAERNRDWFAGRAILALNLMSSPGSGKTSVLECTLRALGNEFAMHVIEGDQATSNDAERIRATGCVALQINTGTGCHLDAAMLARGLLELDPPRGAMVLIENVGNLVCPALFDLGERAKVVILSVTEGEDKPLKYPHMFKASEVILLNKIDLLPYVRFDVERCVAHARQINPSLRVFCVSAQTGEGMADWYGWLRGQYALAAVADSSDAGKHFPGNHLV